MFYTFYVGTTYAFRNRLSFCKRLVHHFANVYVSSRIKKPFPSNMKGRFVGKKLSQWLKVQWTG